MLKVKQFVEEALTARARDYAHPAVSGGLKATNSKLAEVVDKRWPFDAEVLKTKAIEKTGLDDFGPAYFEKALEMICLSAREDLDLNPVGHRNLWYQVFDHLAQRLRFVDLWKRHPEILEEVIEKPIFIVGLPRSGTTFLHQLLAQDAGMRVTPFWEELSPLPDHDPAQRPPQDEPLIERARQNIEGLREHAPGLLEMHQLAVDEPEEEIYLLGPAFASMAYEWVYIMPQYADWYARQDHTQGYLFFRQILQTLQWMRGGGRWLLKAPQHMEQIGPLMAAFPDALFVSTLRDPVTAATSVANLSAYGQRIRTDRPDPVAAGSSCTLIIERLVGGLLRDQPEGDPRFLEIHFADLMADPIGAARTVFAAAGIDVTPATEAAMRDYVARNDAKPRKSSDYASQDFGIDVPALRKKIEGYYTRYGVTPDPRFG
ncbi:sulfotransferase family protein [Novosphingobium malaysiense]|uniref:sulfotransferase family protein n=1 Tax=Novosphingobium malaysiense TaxID=1348853 RepID=UPI000691714C|nr:sulfotransferase [Novosphingobium malaysiense]